MPPWIRFAADNLATGEKILYQTRTHWIILASPAFWSLMYLVGLLVLPTVDINALKSDPVTYGFNQPTTLLGLVLYPLALASALSFIWSLLRMITTEITITNQRVIWKTGLIWRRTGEIARRVIEGNNVDQSILGRILDYGTVWVNGIGNQRLALTTIRTPLEFRSHLNRLAQPPQQPRHRQPHSTKTAS